MHLLFAYNAIVNEKEVFRDDEEEGYPEGGIAPGTKWEDVPEDFECPLCNVGKDQFSEVE